MLLASGVALGIAAAGAGVIGLVRGALARRRLDVDTGRLCQVTVHVRVPRLTLRGSCGYS